MDYLELTEEQKKQIKKLEKRIFKRSLFTGLRNSIFLIAALTLTLYVDIAYVKNNFFVFWMSLGNGILFVRQIRLDISAEDDMVREELNKIFKT